MIRERETAGLPSADKPWQKFYTEEAINGEIPQDSMYGYMASKADDYIDNTALRYFGKEISFRDFLRLIEKTAAALQGVGVSVGDTVTILSMGIPEAIASVYAVNRIGAVACMEYVTQTKESLAAALQKTRSRAVMILDLFLPQFSDVLSRSSVEKVIVLSVNDSLPFPIKQLRKRKQTAIPADRRFVRFNMFVNENSEKIRPIKVDPFAPALMISTSGSTGVPKKVLLSSHNVNSIAWQYEHDGMSFVAGERFMSVAPPFLAFGIVLGVHMPLCLGLSIYAVPNPDPRNTADLFGKYKPNHFLAGPFHSMYIRDKYNNKKMDLSMLKNIGCGGESLTREKQLSMEDFLAAHNCKSHHTHGYGMTEVAGTAILENNNAYRLGSVGIPLCKTNVKVVDTETGQELCYGEVGELLISTPAIMLGYFENETETERCTEYTDGVKWIKTGDLAKINEDGFVFLKGRIKRIYVRNVPETKQVYKMFPDHIEDTLGKCENVKECAVIVIPDDVFGNIPVAFVVLGINDLEARERTKKEAEQALPIYEHPYSYCFVEEIPKTQSGKKDYQLLEKKAKETIN